jgi:hypothetical protein
MSNAEKPTVLQLKPVVETAETANIGYRNPRKSLRDRFGGYSGIASITLNVMIEC